MHACWYLNERPYNAYEEFKSRNCKLHVVGNSLSLMFIVQNKNDIKFIKELELWPWIEKIGLCGWKGQGLKVKGQYDHAATVAMFTVSMPGLPAVHDVDKKRTSQSNYF